MKKDAQSMFRVGKLNAFKLTAPEGAALSVITVEMASWLVHHAHLSAVYRCRVKKI